MGSFPLHERQASALLGAVAALSRKRNRMASLLLPIADRLCAWFIGRYVAPDDAHLVEMLDNTKTANIAVLYNSLLRMQEITTVQDIMPRTAVYADIINRMTLKASAYLSVKAVNRPDFDPDKHLLAFHAPSAW